MDGKRELHEYFHPEILDDLYEKLDDFLNYLCRDCDEAFVMCFIPSHAQVGSDKNCMTYLMKVYPKSLPSNVVILNGLLQRKEMVLANHDGGNRSENCKTIVVNPRYEKRVLDKHIILMDDVATTGITTDYASKILSAAGAKQVTCVTLSKTYTAYKRRNE